MTISDLRRLIEATKPMPRLVIMATKGGWEFVRRHVPSVDQSPSFPSVTVELFETDSQVTMRLIELAHGGAYDEVIQVFSDRILLVDLKLFSSMLSRYAVDV